MAADPTGGDLTITVAPSALGEAGGVAAAVGQVVAVSLHHALTGSRGQAAGDGGCAEALARAVGMLEQTVQAASDGVCELARALAAAADTYRVAEDVAVGGSGS
jgi:hypothetical protein